VIHLIIIAEDTVAFPPIAAPASSVGVKSLRKPNLAAARQLLDAGMCDVCLLAVSAIPAEARQWVTEFRAAAPDCPLVAVMPEGTPEGERAAYLGGADVVLTGPLDLATILTVVQRLAARARTPEPVLVPSVPVPPGTASVATPAYSALAVMRDFSQVLNYSLDYQQFTRHFILKVCDIIGVSRIAIFLEPPPVSSLGATVPSGGNRLVCAGAVGLPPDLLANFELSRDSGLGRGVLHAGKILRLGADSTAPFLARDPRLQREFDILGCEIALPISDRERILGVALLGGRLTGAPFADAELLLVYHLMEELGLAVKNSWLHRELGASHRLFSEVLGAMTAGALVVDSELAVLFANDALLRLLKGKDAPASARLGFDGLPAPLAAGLREVVEQGRSRPPFFYEHPGPPPATLQATLLPLPAAGRLLPQPALLVLEDFTQVRAAQRAEIEASNLKLIGLIARRFAHEIRNSLVPLTTHQQLFDTDYANAEFRDSLKHALTRETGRIQRFTEQMIFLAQTEGGATDLLPLEDLLRHSFAHSRDFLGRENSELEIRSEMPHPLLRGNRASLMHALQEIFLNGLQSAGEPPRVTVTVVAESGADGRPGVALRVRDNGGGFAPEVAARATDPFFTTRNTGVGLGLSVAKRVIEAHAGRLEVQTRHQPEDPDLVIHLPSNT
jgi:signal transduction histidine kinase/DNA-binding response OmpR family regulator